jgi:hypothetical protein
MVFRESRELGCPVSKFVRKSARERSREPSRAIFGQLDNSARLSVGQAKNFGPRLGRRSDRARKFGGRARSLPNDFGNGVTKIGNGVTKIKILYAIFQLILSIK